MASMEALGSKQQAFEFEIMSVTNGYNEEEILKQIDEIHVTAGEEFDAESLFILVENIVKHAAPIVGSFVPVQYTPSWTTTLPILTLSAIFFFFFLCLLVLVKSLVFFLIFW